MSKLRVHCFAISVDGFGAGPNQDLEHPLGVNGQKLHEWFYPTQTFRAMIGADGGTTGIDNDFAMRGIDNVGATIMGRNMFGPVRDAWPNDEWRGWWGDNPPFHTPVFVLTHHPRASIVMDGGTTFHFVTDGIYAALERASDAAGKRDVRLGGGANLIRQFLHARLVDEMHLAIAPVALGAGESLFADINLPQLGYQRTEHVPGPHATHIVFKRTPDT